MMLHLFMIAPPTGGFRVGSKTFLLGTTRSPWLVPVLALILPKLCVADDPLISSIVGAKHANDLSSQANCNKATQLRYFAEIAKQIIRETYTLAINGDLGSHTYVLRTWKRIIQQHIA